MKLLSQNSQLKNSTIIFGFLLLVILLLVSLYWFEILTNSKWPAIISGLLTGFIVALFQTCLSWFEIRKMDKYDSLKIIDILPRRDDREYYEKFISKATTSISIQGVTAQRFLDHFANEKSTRIGAKAVLTAMARGVEVRILVASSDVLTNDKDIKKAAMAEPHLEQLSARYPKFKHAYFKHLPTHSILTVDDESIVGPIFPEVSSEFTPAIHLKNDSEFVKYYLEYFKNEWDQWRTN